MANDEDPDKWLMGGPVAWFAMAAIVAIIVGAVGWGYAEFRADRAVRDALALAADEPARESLRNELDLAAQQTMATAAIVATVLSALSMAFVALTVWFTRDASVQARKSLALSQRALDETLSASRRELRPYLFATANCSEILGFDEIKVGTNFIIKIHLNNFGKTPFYFETLRSTLSMKQNGIVIPIVRERFIGVTIEPMGEFKFAALTFSANLAWDEREYINKYPVFFEFIGSDLFHNKRICFANFVISAKSPMRDDGFTFEDCVRLEIRAFPGNNPLRPQDGVQDGVTDGDSTAAN